MKSARLMSTLLLLQTRGSMTAEELARRFEVSRRTILRDVEALSEAGVPVHTERGRGGGIVLDRRARLDLSRLEPAELQLLAAAGLDARQLDAVGLGDLGTRAQEKLEAAMRGPLTPDVPLADVLRIDSAGWFVARSDGGSDSRSDGSPTADPGADLTALLDACRGRRRVELAYRRSGESAARRLTVDPYGLVSKAGSWYLVGDVEGTARMFNAARIRPHIALPEPARLRDGETLASVWTALLEQFSPAPALEVRALLRANRLDLARRILGARLIGVSEPEGDRVTITVACEELEAVRQLLQFGDHLQVVDPPEAVQRVHELAQQLAAAHAPAAEG